MSLIFIESKKDKVRVNDVCVEARSFSRLQNGSRDLLVNNFGETGLGWCYANVTRHPVRIELDVQTRQKFLRCTGCSRHTVFDIPIRPVP